MLNSCQCLSSRPDSMGTSIPRPIAFDENKAKARTSVLKRKGSTLQTSVEVLRCRFAKPRQPGNATEGDQEFSPSKDWTPFYHAVYHQREAALIHFLESGESPNETTSTGTPPLCIAVASGNAKVVSTLLQYGANVNAVTKSKNESALHIAIRLSHSDLIDLLIPHSPELHTCTLDTRETPLHYAASKSGSLATVVTLLKRGAKYDALNAKGQTPAEAALLANNLHAAVAIINAAPRKRSKMAKEKEMLLKHVQKTKGRFSIGNDLIADIFSATCDPDSTVLVEAIKKDDAGLVEMFLEKGSDPDRQTARGHRPLFVALECAGAPVIHTLVKHQADVLVRDDKGLTVLQAAFNGPLAQDNAAFSTIFDALLSKGADPLVTYPDGKTLLHRAVSSQFGNSRVAHLLISSGVKVDAQDRDGNSAMHIGTHNRACTELLLKNGASPHLVNHDDLTPLLYAATCSTKGRESDLDALIKVSDLRKTNSKGQTPLHLAALNGLEKMIRSLLRARADTTSIDSDKNTALLLAVKKHQWAVVPLLTIPPSINSWDEDGMSALHHIARSKPEAQETWKDIAAAAVPFCGRGVSRSMRDRLGATPLIQAVRTLPEEGLQVVEALLVQKTDLGASRNCVNHEDHQHHDALHYAATLSKPKFVEALLKHGALFEFKDWTPESKKLDVSTAANQQTMRLLAQYEWARRAGSMRRQSSGPNTEGSIMSTVFSVKDVKQMISMGLDVNALPRSPLGNSLLWAVLRHIPIQPSVSSKYLYDMVSLFLDSGGDPNFSTARGTKQSPSPQLPRASRHSLPLSMHPLTFLLEEIPTVDIDLVTLLITKGTKLSIASPFYNGRYPLHSAVKANRIDLVDEFLLQRTDVHTRDKNGRTALFIASEKGFWEIVDSLLRRGANPDVTDGDKNTPLHVAASGGSRKVITSLLRAGAKANTSNAKGQSPLACLAEGIEEKEKDKIVAMLKDAESMVNHHGDKQKQQVRRSAESDTKAKQQKEVAAETKLKRVQEEKVALQKTQKSPVSQSRETERAQKPLPPIATSPSPSKTSTTETMPKPARQPSSILRKSSLFSARPKIIPPPSDPQPKSTAFLTKHLAPTTTTPPPPPPPSTSTYASKPTVTKSSKPSSSNPKSAYTISPRRSTSPSPLHVSKRTPPTTTASTTNTNTNILSIPSQKPPRIDSGIGPSRPTATAPTIRPVLSTPSPPPSTSPPLDPDALSKALLAAPSRDSGHELKDWLAVSRVMGTL